MPGRGASRRAWGWHPLRPEWASRIVADAGVGPGDLVLDLGAGDGALTAPLLRTGARVLAVELHPGRLERLRHRFAGDVDAGRLTLVRADLRELRLPRRPFRVVAAPPYGLTTGLVRTLLDGDRMLRADLVLQRATARRLADDPPRARHARRYGLELGAPVPRTAFRPPPRVDSSVLTVRRR